MFGYACNNVDFTSSEVKAMKNANNESKQFQFTIS